MSDDFDFGTPEEQRQRIRDQEQWRLRRAIEDQNRLVRRSQHPVEAKPKIARGLTVRAIRAAAARVREDVDGTPPREKVAELLHTTVRTLARAMQDLGMESWPPGPPDD